MQLFDGGFFELKRRTHRSGLIGHLLCLTERRVGRFGGRLREGFVDCPVELAGFQCFRIPHQSRQFEDVAAEMRDFVARMQAPYCGNHAVYENQGWFGEAAPHLILADPDSEQPLDEPVVSQPDARGVDADLVADVEVAVALTSSSVDVAFALPAPGQTSQPDASGVVQIPRNQFGQYDGEQLQWLVSRGIEQRFPRSLHRPGPRRFWLGALPDTPMHMIIKTVLFLRPGHTIPVFSAATDPTTAFSPATGRGALSVP